MQTLFSNKTTFGMNANKTKGPRDSLFILVNKLTGPDSGHCAGDNWAKIPVPVTQKLLSGATLPRHKGTSLISSLFNMAQLAWGSLNPALYKWEPPLISKWFHSVLLTNRREDVPWEKSMDTSKRVPQTASQLGTPTFPLILQCSGALNAPVWR